MIYHWSDGWLDANQLMEPFYLEGEYAIKITAHDDKGQILGSNEGFFSNDKKSVISVPGVQYSEGDLLLLDNDYEKAIQDYNRALEIDPDHIRALNNRGDLFREREELEKAIADYSRLLVLEPNAAGNYCNRCLCWNGLREYDNAIPLKGRGEFRNERFRPTI